MVKPVGAPEYFFRTQTPLEALKEAVINAANNTSVAIPYVKPFVPYVVAFLGARILMGAAIDFTMRDYSEENKPSIHPVARALFGCGMLALSGYFAENRWLAVTIAAVTPVMRLVEELKLTKKMLNFANSEYTDIKDRQEKLKDQLDNQRKIQESEVNTLKNELLAERNTRYNLQFLIDVAGYEDKAFEEKVKERNRQL